MELGLDYLLLLTLVAGVAGFIDTIAGGGGLITIPVLLLSGMNPIAALATNKFQATGGSTTASIRLIRKGLAMPLKSLWRLIALVFIGSSLGALILFFIDMQALEVLIPIVLGFIAFYYLFAKGAGDLETKPRMSAKIYNRTILPLIGFYDGCLGPGTGAFFATSLVALRGKNLIEATVYAKIFNATSNIASLIIFLFGGMVVWSAGIAMLIGQIIGASFGAKAVVSGGTKIIRPLLVLMSLLMLSKYFYEFFAG